MKNHHPSPEQNREEQNSLPNRTQKTTLATSLMLTTLLLFSSPSKGGVSYDIGHNWQDREDQITEKQERNHSKEQKMQDMERKVLLQEKQKAIQKLENTDDYQEKREIIEYIEYLNRILEGKTEGESEGRHVIEVANEYPKEIFIEIEKGIKEINKLKTGGKRKPRDRDTEKEKEKLDEVKLEDNQLSKGETVRGILYYDRYSEDIKLKYDGSQLIFQTERETFRIPITEDNKNEHKKLIRNDDEGRIIIKLNRRE